jgi:hypothetical protein
LSQARTWGIQSEDTKACLSYLVENRADQFPRLDEERPVFGRVWVSAYSALGSLPIAKADLAFLKGATPVAPQASKGSPGKAEESPKEKAAPAAKAPSQASAEEAMAKQIRDDGTLDTDEGLLFEEDE